LAIPKDVDGTSLLFNHIKTEKCGSIFLSNAPFFRKSLAFWKVPRLRPFVFLVRAIVDEDECEDWWNGTGRRKKKYLEKNLFQCYFVQHITHLD